MHFAMPTDLTLLAAQHALDVLDVDSLTETAVQAVCDGIDGRSMVYLAGTTAADSLDEKRQLFVRALREHAQPIPSRLDAAKRLILHFATAVVERRVAPLDGAWELVCCQQAVAAESTDAKFIGDALGVEQVYGLYYSVDDHNADELPRIEAEIIAECRKIAGL